MMRGHTNPCRPTLRQELAYLACRQISESNDSKASNRVREVRPNGISPATPFGISPAVVAPLVILPVRLFGMSPAKAGMAKARTSTEARINLRIVLFLL